MLKKVVMENLMCSSCASKIEKKVMTLSSVKSASFNFANQTMLLDVEDNYNEAIETVKIKAIVDSIETGINTYPYSQKNTINSSQKSENYTLFYSGVLLYILGLMGDYYSINILPIILYWIGYLLIASKIAFKTINGIKNKDFFNENTLMFIATIAAMSLGEYFEAILVIILYTFGEFLQQKAVYNSKEQIASLIDLRIEYANVLIDNELIIKDPLSIKINDTIVVRNGEKIPVDGKVIKGISSLNTSALTGESKLTDIEPGDSVLSGNINVGEVIHIKAEKEYKDSTISKMIDLIENSTNHKAKPEKFITAFARYYTPLVMILALSMFLIPSLINFSAYQVYLYRAATFLVISCPCALILSIPLSYFAGIGAASKKGILFKGSSFLHLLTNVDVIGIDKTGTITHGKFSVVEYSDEETLKIAASIEKYSTHPIGQAIINYYDGELIPFDSVEEKPGYGLIAKSTNETILVGNQKLLKENNIDLEVPDSIGTTIFVAINNQYKGFILVSDTIKESSYDAIKNLKEKYKITMLTGDNFKTAKQVAKDLDNIEYKSDLLPSEKINAFNGLESTKNKVFIGDGINDAPLLKNADIGIAMGQGSELAIDVADIVIMNDDIHLVETAFNIAHKTKKIVYQNIIFSLGIKILFLFLAGFGISKMWMAIFADVGVTLIAVLNSLRIIYTKKL